MKKKMLIGSLFAVLLMLSMPFISNIQAKSVLTENDKNIENLGKTTITEPKNYAPFLCFILLLGIVFGIADILGYGFLGIVNLLRRPVASILALAVSLIIKGLNPVLIDDFSEHCGMDNENSKCIFCGN